MHASMESLPAERLGDYEAYSSEAGDMTVIFERMPKGFPPGGEELYDGLPERACQCPHWGYVFSGRLEFHYTDGEVEVFGPGEAYYARPGHRWKCLEESHTVEFSPTELLEENSGTIRANLDRAAGLTDASADQPAPP